MSVLDVMDSDSLTNPFPDAEYQIDEPIESIPLEARQTIYEANDPHQDEEADDAGAEREPYGLEDDRNSMGSTVVGVGMMNPTEHQSDGQHNEGYRPDPSAPAPGGGGGGGGGGAAAAGGRLPPLPEIGSVRGTARLPPLVASGPEFERVKAWGSLPPIRGISKMLTAETEEEDSSL